MSSYVYCVTRASHPLPLEGAVGDHAPALRLLREQDLVAVVSDAPDNLRAKRRDLAQRSETRERQRRWT
jgi:Gas vesicle synthesis protein GvpL/GvpF